jgi:hypothetical protein
MLISSMATQAQTYASAVDYNDAIVGLQDDIATALISFNESLAVEAATAESVDPYFQELIRVTEKSLAKISAMPDYNGDTLLRASAKDLFGFYISCFNNEYKTVLSIFFDPEMDAADFERMTSLLNDISLRESVYDLSFQTAQRLFALKNGFTLDENALQDDLNGDE